MSLATRLSDLAYAIGTDMKALRVMITGAANGNLTGLSTAAKDSLVNAINEVNAKPTSGAPPDATTTAKGVVELATLAEVAAGVDTTLVVTPEGVRQERVALKAEILGAGIPAALDTLKELADAIGDDANFASSTTTALGNRLRVDVNNQGLTSQQQANGQTNLGVLSSAAIGDPETDFVAVYTTAKT
jgi:hypothetical protein